MTDTIRAGDLTTGHLGHRFLFVDAPFCDPYEAAGALTTLAKYPGGTVTIELEDDDSLHELNLHPNNTLEAL